MTLPFQHIFELHADINKGIHKQPLVQYTVKETAAGSCVDNIDLSLPNIVCAFTEQERG